MDDLISRRAALDCVTYDVEYTIERIKELPSAQPEQKKGEWIKNEWINGRDDGWTCSVCNYHDGDITYDYCPKCKSYNGGEL